MLFDLQESALSVPYGALGIVRFVELPQLAEGFGPFVGYSVPPGVTPEGAVRWGR